MKRIGIYGGTFHPPHIGHVRAAEHAVDALRLDALLVIPACHAPHKQLPADAPTPQQRLEMTRIAFAPVKNAQVSDMELCRGGVSYTWETVEAVRAQYPDAELFLLLGADMLEGFLNWRQPQTILKNAALAVFCRGGKQEREALSAPKEQLEKMGAAVQLLENPVTDISSTQLRRMLAFRCAEPFLPSGVGAYIRENGLYGTGKDYRNLPMEELEQVVVSLLKPNRVSHVLGCRDTAVAMAKRWGTDETDAARAGILHDITKALDGPLQLTLCKEYNILLDTFSTQNPKTLHALTGSLVAQRIFGENNAVVEAIRSHTTGKADMNTLQKIIYVADYMEPNRDFAGVEQLRQLAFTDLDAALKLGLEMTLAMLRQQGREVSPESQQAIDWLNHKN